MAYLRSLRKLYKALEQDWLVYLMADFTDQLPTHFILNQTEQSQYYILDIIAASLENAVGDDTHPLKQSQAMLVQAKLKELKIAKQPEAATVLANQILTALKQLYPTKISSLVAPTESNLYPALRTLHTIMQDTAALEQINIREAYCNKVQKKIGKKDAPVQIKKIAAAIETLGKKKSILGPLHARIIKQYFENIYYYLQLRHENAPSCLDQAAQALLATIAATFNITPLTPVEKQNPERIKAIIKMGHPAGVLFALKNMALIEKNFENTEELSTVLNALEQLNHSCLLEAASLDPSIILFIHTSIQNKIQDESQRRLSPPCHIDQTFKLFANVTQAAQIMGEAEEINTLFLKNGDPSKAMQRFDQNYFRYLIALKDPLSQLNLLLELHYLISAHIKLLMRTQEDSLSTSELRENAHAAIGAYLQVYLNLAASLLLKVDTIHNQSQNPHLVQCGLILLHQDVPYIIALTQLHREANPQWFTHIQNSYSMLLYLTETVPAYKNIAANQLPQDSLRIARTQATYKQPNRKAIAEFKPEFDNATGTFNRYYFDSEILIKKLIGMFPEQNFLKSLLSLTNDSKTVLDLPNDWEVQFSQLREIIIEAETQASTENKSVLSEAAQHLDVIFQKYNETYAIIFAIIFKSLTYEEALLIPYAQRTELRAFMRHIEKGDFISLNRRATRLISAYNQEFQKNQNLETEIRVNLYLFYSIYNYIFSIESASYEAKQNASISSLYMNLSLYMLNASLRAEKAAQKNIKLRQDPTFIKFTARTLAFVKKTLYVDQTTSALSFYEKWHRPHTLVFSELADRLLAQDAHSYVGGYMMRKGRTLYIASKQAREIPEFTDALIQPEDFFINDLVHNTEVEPTFGLPDFLKNQPDEWLKKVQENLACLESWRLHPAKLKGLMQYLNDHIIKIQILCNAKKINTLLLILVTELMPILFILNIRRKNLANATFEIEHTYANGVAFILNLIAEMTQHDFFWQNDDKVFMLKTQEIFLESCFKLLKQAREYAIESDYQNHIKIAYSIIVSRFESPPKKSKAVVFPEVICEAQEASFFKDIPEGTPFQPNYNAAIAGYEHVYFDLNKVMFFLKKHRPKLYITKVFSQKLDTNNSNPSVLEKDWELRCQQDIENDKPSSPNEQSMLNCLKSLLANLELSSSLEFELLAPMQGALPPRQIRPYLRQAIECIQRKNPDDIIALCKNGLTALESDCKKNDIPIIIDKVIFILYPVFNYLTCTENHHAGSDKAKKKEAKQKAILELKFKLSYLMVSLTALIIAHTPPESVNSKSMLYFRNRLETVFNVILTFCESLAPDEARNAWLDAMAPSLDFIAHAELFKNENERHFRKTVEALFSFNPQQAMVISFDKLYETLFHFDFLNPSQYFKKKAEKAAPENQDSSNKSIRTQVGETVATMTEKTRHLLGALLEIMPMAIAMAQNPIRPMRGRASHLLFNGRLGGGMIAPNTIARIKGVPTHLGRKKAQKKHEGQLIAAALKRPPVIPFTFKISDFPALNAQPDAELLHNNNIDLPTALPNEADITEELDQYIEKTDATIPEEMVLASLEVDEENQLNQATEAPSTPPLPESDAHSTVVEAQVAQAITNAEGKTSEATPTSALPDQATQIKPTPFMLTRLPEYPNAYLEIQDRCTPKPENRRQRRFNMHFNFYRLECVGETSNNPSRFKSCDVYLVYFGDTQTWEPIFAPEDGWLLGYLRQHASGPSHVQRIWCAQGVYLHAPRPMYNAMPLPPQIPNMVHTPYSSLPTQHVKQDYPSGDNGQSNKRLKKAFTLE